MTAVSVPTNSTAETHDDPVVEVSLVSDPPVATLALSLLAATRAAALACLPWVGRDEPKAADAAAVAAMRESLALLPGRATVVIGEGEKDDAPMLDDCVFVATGGDRQHPARPPAADRNGLAHLLAAGHRRPSPTPRGEPHQPWSPGLGPPPLWNGRRPFCRVGDSPPRTV